MGRLLGNYELGETLGKGMSGKVRLGMDTRTGEFVAIKIMFKEKMSRRAFSQLTLEISAMQSIQHPSVLSLKDVMLDAVYVKKNGTSHSAAILVIEIAKGGELFDFMMYTGAFRETIARTYFGQLLSALDTCHRQGIAHRDIKPENILLDSRFNLKLADFGLSSYREHDGSLCKTECGTRSYMAPEVLARELYIGSKADIWSAGVVLFIMLNGNPPFQIAAGNDWWFKAVSHNRYDRFWAAHLRGCPDFPPLAQEFLNTIFVKDPEKRATIASLMAHPWMQGPVASEADLAEELTARRVRVQEEKARSRQAHIRAKMAEAQKRGGGGQADALFSKNVQRSVGRRMMDGIGGGVGEDGDPDDGMIVVPTYPADDDKQQFVLGKEFHSLYSVEPVEELLKKLPEALAACTTKEGGDRPVVTVKLQQAKVKALFPERELEVMVRIFLDEKVGCHVIVMSKRQGDVYDFIDMQDRLVEAMGGAVASAYDVNVEPKEAYDDDDLDDLEGSISRGSSGGGMNGGVNGSFKYNTNGSISSSSNSTTTNGGVVKEDKGKEVEVSVVKEVLLQASSIPTHEKGSDRVNGLSASGLSASEQDAGDKEEEALAAGVDGIDML